MPSKKEGKTARKTAGKPGPARKQQKADARFHSSVFIHPAATVIGDVVLGQDVSIWPGAVLRGDMNRITLGRAVNIQDNCTLHVDSSRGLSIDDYTLVGHNAMVHSCKIGKGCLIGIAAVILDGAEIGDGAMITAGCIVRGGKKIPPFSNVFWKGGELVIHENKARPILTIAGSIEYIELARRLQNGIFAPFTEAEESQFKRQAEVIGKELFGVPKH